MGFSLREPHLIARPRLRLAKAVLALIAGVCVCIFAVKLSGQNTSTGLTLLTKDVRRSIPLTVNGPQELVALDDLATAFQLTVREESGAITVTYRGRTIVLTADQPLASVAGRLVSLPSAPVRTAGRWLVPVEFVSRALALVYDQRLDLRRPSHLLIVGDLRVPRVNVRAEPVAAGVRLTIDSTPKTTSALSQDGGRLLVKFDADAIDPTLPAFQPQPFISGIRIADAVTLDIDLGPRFAAFRASTETIDDTTRLVVDLVGSDANTTSAAPPGRGSVAPPGPPPADLPAIGTPTASIRTIAIDAGHGGGDVGVKGPGGTAEKDVTLAVARRLKAAIEARLGVRVLLTRDDDRSVPLDDRIAVANNSKADLFISLHANGSLRGTPTGADIYVARFDEGERKAVLTPERLPALSGGTRDIELVEWDVAQLRSIDASTRMAGYLRDEFGGRIALDGRQVSPSAPLRLLESANMPAVLIEMGYLSNPEQEAQMTGADFQNKFVQAVIDAVVKFRDDLDGSDSR